MRLWGVLHDAPQPHWLADRRCTQLRRRGEVPLLPNSASLPKASPPQTTISLKYDNRINEEWTPDYQLHGFRCKFETTFCGINLAITLNKYFLQISIIKQMKTMAKIRNILNNTSMNVEVFERFINPNEQNTSLLRHGCM